MSSVTIKRMVDIEETIRAALAGYLTVYVRPLPATLTLPSIEITSVGGSEKDDIDSFDVMIDARAEDEEAAMNYLRNAVGLIEHIAESQTTDLRYAAINALSSWGRDPVRPNLAMCTARIRAIAHKEKVNLEV